MNDASDKDAVCESEHAGESKLRSTTAASDCDVVEEGASDDVADEFSESSDEELDSQLSERASVLEQEISVNLYMYESHVELVSIYKTQGELEALRAARQRFSEAFPLTEELWLDWVNDEKELADGDADRLRLAELLSRAVDDYLSVTLWMEYCTLTIGLGDTDRCRDVMGHATDVAGFHTAEGKLLWDLRLEYEQALLDSMQPAPGACLSAQQQSLIEAQTSRVDTLYKELVVTPIVGVEAALAEYELWLGEAVSEDLKKAHKVAAQILIGCNRHENALSSAQTTESKGEVYQTYLDWYMDRQPQLTGSIRCLFERALASSCLDEQIWTRYTTYLAKIKTDEEELLIQTYKRSVRNCPWSSALWVSYCLISERQKASLETLEGLMESALLAGLPSAAGYLDVWTTYCDVLRRRLDWSQPGEGLLRKLREVFERAVQHLLKYYGEEGDEDCQLPKYWALIEAKHCNNMEKAREIWNDTLTGWRHDKAQAWLEYVNFERSYGDHKHCRRVFQRALKAVSDWPLSICSEYVRFEKEEGTLDQLYVAQHRVGEIRHKIEQVAKARKPRVGSTKGNATKGNATKGNATKGNATKGNATKGYAAKGDTTMKEKQQKPAHNSGSADFKPPTIAVYKRKRAIPSSSEESEQKEAAEFKLPNAPADGRPPSKKLKAAGTDMGVAAADKEDVVPDYSTTDNTTVFVSNLAYTIIDTHLSQLFGQKCGEVKEVRVMKGPGDKSKGFAYVEFKSADSVPTALNLDRTEIEGRPMYVSPCNRKRSENAPKLKYDTGMEKSKLFISGLPYSMTAEQLGAVFAKHSKVKDVRIVCYRGGKSKGLAYVEFFSESEARQALLAMDQQVIDGFTIKVAISNPPTRKPAETESQYIPSLGGASKQLSNSLSRGKARTQLDLTPRVVQRKPPTAPAAAPAGSSQQTAAAPAASLQQTADAKSAPTEISKKKLSNADFRSMLLSKK